MAADGIAAHRFWSNLPTIPQCTALSACGLFLCAILGLYIADSRMPRSACATDTSAGDAYNPETVASTTGIIVTIFGNVLNAVGITVQKHAHTRIRDTTRSYICSLTWWVGLGFVAIGESSNAVAYGLAPTNIIAPLGAISIVVSETLGVVVFRERLSGVEVVASLIIVAGVVVCATTTPTQTTLYVASTLLTDEVYLSPGTLLLLVAVLVYALLCAFVLEPRFPQQVWVIASYAAFVSATTVASCRGLFSMTSLIVKDCSGNLCLADAQRLPCYETIGSYLYWMLVGVTAVGAVFANAVLEQRGLSRFPQSRFVPVHFGFTTLSFVLVGAIVFGDFEYFDARDVALFSVGAACILCGVAALVSKGLSGG